MVAALEEVVSSIPSMQVKHLTSTVTPDAGDLMPSSALHIGTCISVVIHTDMHTQINKNKTSLLLKKSWTSPSMAVLSPSLF